jgi:glucokinase
VGGTKISGGVVTRDGQIIARAQAATPREDGASVVAAISQLIDTLREAHPLVEAIGVGAAGMVDWPSGHIRWAPNNSYRRLPLRAVLAETTGLPTVVDNDANVAAWAETRVGAGAGHRHVVVVTVGTGVGAGVVIDNILLRGHTGIAAEVGHIQVDTNTSAHCGCGKTGCLEAMASGTALGRAAQAAAAADPTGTLAKLAGGASNITGETVTNAATTGDPTARCLFDQLGYWLGIGIANLVTLFDPELVILTGGLLTTGDLLLTPTRASYHHTVFAPSHRTLPPLLPAHLGTDAGLIGAGLLALDTLHSHHPALHATPTP